MIQHAMPRGDIDARARAIAERCAARRASYETHGGGTDHKTSGRTCRLSWRELAARTAAANRRTRAKARKAKAAKMAATLAALAAAECERNRIALQGRCASVSEAFTSDDSAGFGFTMREGRRASGGARDGRMVG